MTKIVALALGLSLALCACDGKRAPFSKTGSRFALLAGASGEKSEPNFFLQDLGALRAALVARGWQVNAVVGSKDGLLPGSVRASNANILEGVRETLGAAGPGQQAILLFHSHGRERETYWGQRSHSIVSEDRDASGADPGFDLDAIEPELLRARERGVKVAFIDLSCYSGSSQALKGAACTVSLAASRYVSLCSGREEEKGFNSRFFKLPPPEVPVSLEAQFFEARRLDHASINLAQISSQPTPALAAWEKFLVSADPLDTFEDLKDLKTGTKPFDPRELTGEVDQWIARLPAGLRDEARGLRAAIARELGSALALRKSLEGRMKALADDYDVNPLEVTVPGRATLKLAPAYLFELLDASRSGQVPDGYTDAQTHLLGAIKPVQTELANRFAAPLGAFRARRDEFDQGTDDFAQAADALFGEERKLYDLRPAVAAPNPCSEFGL